MFEKCEEQIWRFGTALQYSPPFFSIVDLLSTRRSSSAAGSDAAASKSSFGTSHVCEKINPLDPFNGDPAQHHWYGCGGGVGPIWGALLIGFLHYCYAVKYLMTKGPWLASIGVEIFSTPEILGEHNLWNLRKFTFCLNLWFPPTPAVATWLDHVMWKHVSSSRAHRPLWARHQCNPSHKSGRRHVQLAPIYANAARWCSI